MKSAYSAKQLADLAIPGLPASERGIQLRAKKEKWQAISQPCQGGYTVKYLALLLPSEVRLAIAAATAVKKIKAHPGHGAGAGADLAATVVKQNAINIEQDKLNKERGLAAYTSLAQEKKAIADARREILSARNAFIRAAGITVKAGTHSFCDHYRHGALKLRAEIREIIGPTLSWSTINRWQQAYDAHGMIGLAPGYRNPNKGNTTVPEPMRAMISGLIVEHLGIKLSRVMDALAARFPGQDAPSESAVGRFISRYRHEHAALFEFLENPDKWRSNRLLAFGSASENITRLNQVWEFDSTVGDVMLKDGRHCVLGVIDVFSRRLKLLVSPTSKATSVAALTRAAIIDWGVPEVAHTDNGADYVSKHMVRVFDGLGIVQELCDPFQPQQKPHIERAFRTFSHSICELLPGFVGHSVADRKGIEARRSFAQRMMEGGDPVEISLTASEFQAVCDRWVTAIYHQDRHAGLHDQTPAQVARAWTQPVRRITDLRALDVLLSEAPGDGLRTVGKKGVQVDNIFYQAPEFGAMVDGLRQVKVLLDAADLGTIHCYDPATGAFICVAVDPLRKGIDRAEMAARGRTIQKQVMSDGVKELRRIAKEAGTQGINEEILLHREAQIVNTVDLPRLAMEYTTPALNEASLAAEALAGKRKEPLRLTDEEFARSETILAELERKSGIRLAMPATETETYDMLLMERDGQGLELSDREERWVLEYERFLDTGKRVGLLAEGWQPYAERARIAKEATL